MLYKKYFNPLEKLVFRLFFFFFTFFAFFCELPYLECASKWKLEGSYIGTGKAKMDEEEHKEEHISYSSSEIQASYTKKSNETDGFTLGISNATTKINWKENPHFSKKNHSYIGLSLSGFSNKIPNWLWVGSIATKVDSEELNFAHYALYQGRMWGRYAYSQMIGIHIGLAGSTGLRRDKVYPILGIDYTPNAKWKIHFVFPLDLSANYSINDYWSIAASGKIFRARHRLNQRENMSKGLFDYRTYGTELSLNYRLRSLLAKIYSGISYPGDLKISNYKGQDPVFYKFKGSFYLGSNLTYGF